MGHTKPLIVFHLLMCTLPPELESRNQHLMFRGHPTHGANARDPTALEEDLLADDEEENATPDGERRCYRLL